MKSQPNRTIDGSNDMKTKCSIARFIDNVRDDYTNGARDIYSDSMVFDLQFNGAAFELGENFGRPSFIYLLLLFFFFSKFIVQCVKKRPRNQSHKRIVATQSEIQLRRPIKCDGLGKNTCTGCLFYTHTHTHRRYTLTHLINYS